MVSRLPVSTLLSGFRGRAKGDMAALVSAIVGISQLALELGDEVVAVDVNPLIVTPSGAVAVDALVVPGH
jgi:hypothetical protein